MLRKILVPIDGSEHARSALNMALELARIHGSEVEILHVTSFSEEYTPTESEEARAPMREESLSPSEWMSEYMAKVREDKEKMLGQALRDAEAMYPNLRITSKLLLGRPGGTIVSEAMEGGFDLVVIGSRGLGGLAKLVLGSVSQRVVNESKVPVLVVK